MPRQPATAAALLALALASAFAPAFAQTPAQPGNEQVIQPEVERRELRLPRFPSKDFEVGVFGGVYNTENFGTSGVGGLRLGYHLSEDFFVQGVYGRTKVSDELYREVIYPGTGVLPNSKQTLTYYNLSLGYNVLPGEVFVGGKRAFASQVYVIGGLGSTKFDVGSAGDLKRQTFNFGLGMRVLFHDRMSLQVDMRDHVYKLDLLGRDARTHNLELTTGVSYYF